MSGGGDRGGRRCCPCCPVSLKLAGSTDQIG